MANLYDTLTRGDRRADACFCVGEDGRRMSYADLHAGSARYAHALRAAGVTAGDRVVVQVDKSMEAVLLYFGAVRAGAVFVPINPAYTAAEVDYFLADAEPRLFVHDPAGPSSCRNDIATATLDAAGQGSLAALAARQSDSFATVDCPDEALAAILYTSGTTGRSKGAMLSHGNLSSNALTLADLWRIVPDDVLLHALPIFHTHGLFVAINTIVASGASLRWLQRFDLDAVLAALPASTVLMGVPTFYIRLLADPRLTREATAGMRLFISGSAPLSPEVHRRFAAATGHAVLERYGMTETGMNTANPHDGERRAGTVGFPLPGVEVRITGDDHDVLPPGEVGAIEIAGPNVFGGYWRAPEKTRAAFDGPFFRSGDLGVFDGDGYLAIVGRSNDLIISGGYNIYPAEVEAALDALPAVAESAVIGVPHPDLGEGVVAVVVARPGQTLDSAMAAAALAGRLARFKLPRRIVAVDEMPRNAMGKIQKAILRERFDRLLLDPS